MDDPTLVPWDATTVERSMLSGGDWEDGHVVRSSGARSGRARCRAGPPEIRSGTDPSPDLVDVLASSAFGPRQLGSP